MRNLRSHVMNNYLLRENQNPQTTDVRARGGVARRRRLQPLLPAPRSRARAQQIAAAATASSSSSSTAPATAPLPHATAPSMEADKEQDEEEQRVALRLATRSPVDSRDSDVLEARTNIDFANLKVEYAKLSKTYSLLTKSSRVTPVEVTRGVEKLEIDIQVLKSSCTCTVENEKYTIRTVC